MKTFIYKSKGWDIPKVCLWMSEKYLRHTGDMPETWPIYAIFEIVLRCVWDIADMCLINTWDMPWISEIYIPNKYLKYTGYISDVCLIFFLWKNTLLLTTQGASLLHCQSPTKDQNHKRSYLSWKLTKDLLRLEWLIRRLWKKVHIFYSVSAINPPCDEWHSLQTLDSF